MTAQGGDGEERVRAGFAAIIGAPNAGKSTLTNRIVGGKVSIVTRKVQTTRFPVRGVAMSGSAQIVLVDTPGIFKPRRRLDRAMVASAWGGAQDADVIVLLVDARSELAVAEAEATAADRRSVDDRLAIEAVLKSQGARPLLVINKIDGLRRDRLLGLVQSLVGSGGYEEVFLVSAETGDGVSDLVRRLAMAMPEGPWFYPEDQTADISERVLAAEITREKLYLRVHEELPYACAVETASFKELADGSVRIEQNVLVERDSQRAILLGRGGQTLKWIGQRAREELEGLFERRVHLFLQVKVSERWSEDRALYAQFGLEFDA